MTIQLYIECFLVALIGMLLQAVLKMKSIQAKAKAGNFEFSPSQYFKDDWLSLTASVLTIVLFLFFVPAILKMRPQAIDNAVIFFAFVGYTGSSIVSRIFSVVDKRLNAAIDYKTNIADKETGTLDAPTPMAPIKNTQDAQKN